MRLSRVSNVVIRGLQRGDRVCEVQTKSGFVLAQGLFGYLFHGRSRSEEVSRASAKASVLEVSTVLLIYGTHSLSAVQKINDLRFRTDCTNSFRMIIDMIKDDMRIVIGEGAKANESSDSPHRRWSAGSVRTMLKTIIHEA